MSSAHLDAGASVPQAATSCPAGQAAEGADGRRRVGRWLDRLAGIGTTLLMRMSAIVRYRRAQGAAPGTAMDAGPGRIDLNLAWDLVARAMRWTRALRARLAAEAAAARAAMHAAQGWPEGPERLDDGADWDENLLSVRRAPLAGRALPDDCIDGKPTAEVVGQICADLGVAATLLHGDEAARDIAAIAEAARALLGGPDDAWTPLPMAGAPDRPDRGPGAAPGMSDGAVTPVPAPDTG